MQGCEVNYDDDVSDDDDDDSGDNNNWKTPTYNDN